MKKLAVGLATVVGFALASTAATAQNWHGPRDAYHARAQAYDSGTINNRDAYVFDGGSYRLSTNRFHDNPNVYGNPDRD